MEEIQHHLGYKETCKYWNKLPQLVSRISSINSNFSYAWANWSIILGGLLENYMMTWLSKPGFFRQLCHLLGLQTPFGAKRLHASLVQWRWITWEMWEESHRKRFPGRFMKNQSSWCLKQPIWKNISQNRNLPQVEVSIKNMWNHHLPMVDEWMFCSKKILRIFVNHQQSIAWRFLLSLCFPCILKKVYISKAWIQIQNQI